jgi:hypothetical protein
MRHPYTAEIRDPETGRSLFSFDVEFEATIDDDADVTFIRVWNNGVDMYDSASAFVRVSAIEAIALATEDASFMSRVTAAEMADRGLTYAGLGAGDPDGRLAYGRAA